VIADDRRQMDRNTFSEVVNAFGHVPRDVSPKHGPHTLECLRCNERGIHVNGQMQPSLLEEKCFGQPIPKDIPEPAAQVVIDGCHHGAGTRWSRTPRAPSSKATSRLHAGRRPGRGHRRHGHEQPEEKDGTPKTRSTRRTPASPDVPANLRV
jgi:hypothetical protein